MMEFQFNDLYGSVMNEFPDKQLPDSYPHTGNPTIMPPMNPTPDVPGPDAPEVSPGSHTSAPIEENGNDVPSEDAESA